MSGRNVIYVAPDGDDVWSGRYAAPLLDRSDGPLASFAAARDAARTSDGPDTIAARGGDYYLRDPVEFDERDAGLRIVAVPDQVPVLHGGIPVDGWQAVGDGEWSAPIDLPEGWSVFGLFVDGRPQVLARHPNLPVDTTPRDGWLFADAPLSEMEQNHQFRFHQGDLPGFSDVSGLVVHIVGGLFPGSQWGSDVLPVESIDYATRTVNTGGTAYFFTGEGSRYFLAGRKELLDIPGEWSHDPVAGRLYHRPLRPDFGDADVTIALLGTIFDLKGADGMIVAGLEFRDGAPVGSGKYRTDMRGFGAVRLENSDRVSVLENRFEHVGVAIHVSESREVRVTGNDISHIAGNGIYLGTAYGSFGRSNGAIITKNHIRHVGEVHFETAGIWFQASEGFRIEQNLIEDAAQFGIAGGSLWGEQDASYDGVIRNNIVRDTNQQTADGGAIKLMGAQSDPQNILIQGNLVTGTEALMNLADGSFWPERYEDTLEWPSPISWAIYLDERASGNEIAENLLVGNVAGIGINGGWNNTVRDNVILDGAGAGFRIDDATARDWRPDWAEPNLVEGNSVAIERRDGRVVDINVPVHGMEFVRFSKNRYFGRLTDQSFRVSPPVMASGQFGNLNGFRATDQDQSGSEDVTFFPRGANWTADNWTTVESDASGKCALSADPDSEPE